MVEEKVLVKIHMSKEALETIEALKTKMNVSTEAEVISNALSLLVAVKADNTHGNLVMIPMSKKAIEMVEALKTKMNVETKTEVIMNAISLLDAVEKARNTHGNLVIQSKRFIPWLDKTIDLPWD